MRAWFLLLLLLLASCSETTYRELPTEPVDEPLEQLVQPPAATGRVVLDPIDEKEARLMLLYEERLGLIDRINELYYGMRDESLNQSRKDEMYTMLVQLREEKDGYSDEIMELQREVDTLQEERELEVRIAEIEEEISGWEEELTSARRAVEDARDQIDEMQRVMLSSSNPHEFSSLLEDVSKLRDREASELVAMAHILKDLDRAQAELEGLGG